MLVSLTVRHLGTRLCKELKLFRQSLIALPRARPYNSTVFTKSFSSYLFKHFEVLKLPHYYCTAATEKPEKPKRRRMADSRYCVEYAKTGRSSCKKCKQQIEKGVSRIGKITANPFSDDGGDMKAWFHMQCMFETFKRARATTKKIETPADLEGFGDLKDEEKDKVKSLITEFVSSKSPAKPKPKKKKEAESVVNGQQPLLTAPGPSSASATLAASTKPAGAGTTEYAVKPATPDNSFHGFCELCGRLEKEPSYNAKTKLIYSYLKYGNSGDGFKGDVYVLVKLLLPTSGKKRVYNLQSKQIVKLMSQVFHCSTDDMVEDLEKGDVAETVRTFFESSTKCPPSKTSTLSLADVDTFLDCMSLLTKEEDQRAELAKVVRRCTSQDLRMIIRMIKHDLRINAGAKHVMDALDPNAYAAFQASSDLKDVVDRVMERGGVSGGAIKPTMMKTLSVRANIMTPVKPMLAEACRSVGKAMQKCPHGMYAEIKYDGERVQVHKQGDKFEYFSRTLKAVQSHKVEHIKDYLPKACPHGDSMILDCEVLMIDTTTGKPLPFGTLGVHKKTAFKDACCCLFIFDIIYFNGETLMDKPICDRRQLLEKNIKEVENRIMLSEQTLIKSDDDQVLSDLIMDVIRQGLEGLVLKDVKSVYEPGKRHWLKVKKDYLEGGAMADTADLIVLGGYYGTGSKGGMISVFLMGVYDAVRDKFCTVAKCGNGHDDNTIAKLQKELDMVKIGKDASKVPSWLLIHKNLIPDFVIKDPKAAPVWEITGAEFSNSSTHTAGGISIRFPRVTRIRDDKEWSSATDLDRLKILFKTSKETLDIPGLSAEARDSDGGASTAKGKGRGKKRVSPLSSPTKKKSRKGKRAVKDEEDDSDEEMSTEDESSSSPVKKARTGKESRGVDGAKSSSSTQSPRKAVKRKADADEATSPSKRKKLVCKYGPKCYQTNPKHKEEFLHPWDELEAKCAGVKIEQPLPDLFTGVKIYVSPEVSKASDIKKYFTAYDGEVVDGHHKSEATYFITDGKKTTDAAGSATKLIKADWIWDSLKQEQMLPVDSYVVEH